jgi:outer membrane protein assembly factor BamB
MSDITRLGDVTSEAPPPVPPSLQAPPHGAVGGVSGWSPQTQPRLRLWPAVVIILLEWALRIVPPLVSQEPMLMFMGAFYGPLLALALLVVWWVFFSRVRWSDGFFGVLALAVLGAGSFFLYEPNFGLFPMILYTLPVVTTAWVVWLLATGFLSWPVRRAGLVVVFLLAWGGFALIRFEGVDGSFSPAFAWRWSLTAEQRHQANVAAGQFQSQAKAASETLALGPGDWPGFRGPDRDGKVTGIRIATDWRSQPPKEAWRHTSGPGWSSFAVVGKHLYTQEQLGTDELVVCYDAETGKILWAHKDPARFTETVSGAGPRATPTFHEGKIYALGANGRLNCLDAATGEVKWFKDVVADSGAKVPQWGFSASPAVAGGVVAVFVGAPDGKSVLAYDASSGNLAWYAGEGEYSYCSLHPARLRGADQILVTTDRGLTSFDPASGKILWHHKAALPEGMARVVQPTILSESDVLIGNGFNKGTHRVHVSRKGDEWTTEEVWHTRAISPYFNDLVIHDGCLYGFDGEFLTCVYLEDGKSKWRARGYGNGQIVLLADQGLLVILSEKGDVALVEASPEKHKELGRFHAFDGKTWNHPVVAHGKLFVRNGEWVACYNLPEAGK